MTVALPAHARQAIARASTATQAKASSINSLVAWYRLNSGITIAGQGVSQWDDASGNGNHLLQATDANRPLPGSLGSEIVTDGAFSDSANWTEQAGHSVTAGVLRLTAAAPETVTFQTSGTTFKLGSYYLITYTASGYTGGGFRITIAAGAFNTTTTQSGNGTFAEIVKITNLNDQFIRIAAQTSNTTVDIDDLSIKEIDFTQGILFNGVDQFLKAAFTLSQPTTVYFLGKQLSWTLGNHIFDGNTVNTGQLRQHASSPEVKLFSGTLLGPISWSLDVDAVITARFDGTNSAIRLNKDTLIVDDAGSQDMGGFTLGAGGANTLFSHIQAKEILIYNEAHNANEILDNVLYLGSVGQLTI